MTGPCLCGDPECGQCFPQGRKRGPSLVKLAARINAEFPDLVAIVYPANHPLGGFCDTDRRVAGTRLRRPGKGRRGSRLVVSWRPGHGPACSDGGGHFFTLGSGRCSLCSWDRYGKVFEHNAAETYRMNRDVERWIERQQSARAFGYRRKKSTTNEKK